MRPYALDIPTTREEFLEQLPEIARSQSRIARYTGRGLFTISVATHELALATVVPERFRRAALVHDICETWVGEVPVTIKRRLPELREIELGILRQVADWTGIDFKDFGAIHGYDVAIRVDEQRCIMPGHVSSAPGAGFGVEFHYMPDTAAIADKWLRTVREEVVGRAYA